MSKIVIKNNKIAKLENFSEEIIKKLNNILSFKIKGVEFTPAYQNGWSGINRLLSKNNEFSLGLLPIVHRFLKVNGVKYTQEDLRPTISVEPEVCLDEAFKIQGKEPRQYQIDIVNKAFECERGIVKAATGSGKTTIITMLTAKINKPTNIYVIGIDLLHQFHETLTSFFNEPIGKIGDGTIDIKRINVVSIWTAGKATSSNTNSKIILDDEIDHEDYSPTDKEKILECLKAAKIHIFDECHTITCETAKDIYKTINPERIYGFSGTPYRDDGADLLIHSILGEQIYNLNASVLIEQNFLTQPIIKFIDVPKTYNYTSSNNYQTVYKEYIVENEIRNKLIIDNAKSLIDKGYQVLVLFKQINHGKMLSSLFEEQGVQHEMLSGHDSSEKRELIKNKLLNNELSLILASSIFDIGVDISTLNALVLAGGGKSKIRALQRIGRIIRKHPGKKIAAVVDFFDNVRWLRDHSRIRLSTYESEEGFKIILSKILKQEKEKKNEKDASW